AVVRAAGDRAAFAPAARDWPLCRDACARTVVRAGDTCRVVGWYRHDRRICRDIQCEWRFDLAVIGLAGTRGTGAEQLRHIAVPGDDAAGWCDTVVGSCTFHTGRWPRHAERGAAADGGAIAGAVADAAWRVQCRSGRAQTGASAGRRDWPHATDLAGG